MIFVGRDASRPRQNFDRMRNRNRMTSSDHFEMMTFKDDRFIIEQCQDNAIEKLPTQHL